tara:strand:+ start:255 stop:416 length:162 start_codon:yes stop_codon:yes gene_type:complete
MIVCSELPLSMARLVDCTGEEETRIVEILQAGLATHRCALQQDANDATSSSSF